MLWKKRIVKSGVAVQQCGISQVSLLNSPYSAPKMGSPRGKGLLNSPYSAPETGLEFGGLAVPGTCRAQVAPPVLSPWLTNPLHLMCLVPGVGFICHVNHMVQLQTLF